MSAPEPTSSRTGLDLREKPVSGLISRGMKLYRESKTHLPTSIAASFRKVESVLFPLAYPAQVLSQPVLRVLDDGFATVSEVWETLDLMGKVRMYATGIKGWLVHKLDFEKYMKYMRESYGWEWTEGLRTLATGLYTRMREICRVDDILYISALLLSEGNLAFQHSLLQAWNLAFSPIHFLASIEHAVGDGSLTLHLKENARIFYSLGTLQREIQTQVANLKTRGQKLVRKARDIAARTTFVLLFAADKVIDASLQALDSRVVAKLCAPRMEIGLRGEDLLFDMERRLRSELTLFLSTKQHLFQTSYVYTTVHETLSAVVVFAQGVGTHTKDAICRSELPETLKAPMDAVLVFVGLSGVVQSFDEKVWRRLDKDEDGIVTMRDLFATFSPGQILHSLLQIYESAFQQRVKAQVTNGDY